MFDTREVGQANEFRIGLMVFPRFGSPARHSVDVTELAGDYVSDLRRKFREKARDHEGAPGLKKGGEFAQIQNGPRRFEKNNDMESCWGLNATVCSGGQWTRYRLLAQGCTAPSARMGRGEDAVILLRGAR